MIAAIRFLELVHMYVLCRHTSRVWLYSFGGSFKKSHSLLKNLQCGNAFMFKQIQHAFATKSVKETVQASQSVLESTINIL